MLVGNGAASWGNGPHLLRNGLGFEARPELRRGASVPAPTRPVVGFRLPVAGIPLLGSLLLCQPRTGNPQPTTSPPGTGQDRDRTVRAGAPLAPAPPAVTARASRCPGSQGFPDLALARLPALGLRPLHNKLCTRPFGDSGRAEGGGFRAACCFCSSGPQYFAGRGSGEPRPGHPHPALSSSRRWW